MKRRLPARASVGSLTHLRGRGNSDSLARLESALEQLRSTLPRHRLQLDMLRRFEPPVVVIFSSNTHDTVSPWNGGADPSLQFREHDNPGEDVRPGDDAMPFTATCFGTHVHRRPAKVAERIFLAEGESKGRDLGFAGLSMRCCQA